MVVETKRLEINPTLDKFTYTDPDEMVYRAKIIARQVAYNEKNQDQILAILKNKPEIENQN